MARKFMAALMAAAALVPGIATAQDRGGDRGGDRGRRAERPQSGGGWQARQGGQPGGSWQQRQGGQPGGGGRQRAERPTPAQRPAPAQRPDGGRADAWQRAQQQAPTRNYRQIRPQQGAQAPRPEQVRPDRNAGRDREAWQRNRQAEAQRNWARSGADWNDQARDSARRAQWNEQRRWDGQRGRDDRDGWQRNSWRAGNFDRGYRNDRNWDRNWDRNRDRGGWNRDWRRDSRYDWARWRNSNRNAFRLPRYYAPYGWNQGYRPFGIGAVLTAGLFAQSYWINDPWAYRLPEAYDDFRWVRYYNDALLVDVYTGEVVDVIQNIFW